MAPLEKPHFSADEAAACAGRLFGLVARARALPSYSDQNFLLAAEGGRRYVLKIAARSWAVEGLEFENRALEHLARVGRRPDCNGGEGLARSAGSTSTLVAGLRFPELVPTLGGATLARLEAADGRRFPVRLVTWVPGEPIAGHAPYPPALLEELGRAMGRLDRLLEGLTHPAAGRELDFDARRLARLRPLVAELPSPDRQALADRAFLLFEGLVVPRRAELRRGVIHNDANEYNLLVDPAGEGAPRIVGLIDFGELVESWRVCEPAVAAAYAILDRDDPLAAAAAVVRGYHRELPLTEPEVAALYPLICARLVASVLLAHRERRRQPGNAYLAVSEAPAWRTLERLAAIDPAEAEGAFRAVCGLAAVRPSPGPPPAELLAARRRYLGPSLGLSYRQPLVIVRGRGAYLFDERNRPYLDLVNNVCHVGHCHPHVVAAETLQAARLNTNTRYLHPLRVEYAARLAARLPEPLSVCFFVCSGSEANELALRLARAHTGRRDLLVHEGAYHGSTGALVDASPYKFRGPGGSGEPEPWVHVAAMPDPYRGEHRGRRPESGDAYARGVARELAAATAAGRPIGAFLCEPLLGCGGQIEPPPGYLAAAFRHARAAGAICIADEVQAGFGRLGSHFWGFETQDAVPDVVTLGKPIGNGYPLGAVVTTPEIAASFANGMEYFNTFGGNPVACAVGLAVLEVIERERLQQRAAQVGERLLAGLRRLGERHPLIGDVRGRGLFLGVELVRDRQTLAPAAEEASAIVEHLKAAGVLASTDGPLHNVLKIKPPLVCGLDEADLLTRALDRALTAVDGRQAAAAKKFASLD